MYLFIIIWQTPSGWAHAMKLWKRACMGHMKTEDRMVRWSALRFISGYRTKTLFLFLVLVSFVVLYIQLSTFRQLWSKPNLRPRRCSSEQTSKLLRCSQNQVLWFFSAYVDPRYKNTIRVFVAGNRSLLRHQPRCNIFYEGNISSSDPLRDYLFNFPKFNLRWDLQIF